jgi:hypothetical protein
VPLVSTVWENVEYQMEVDFAAFESLDGSQADDQETKQGRMDNFTFGVNWYLNPYCRMMFNYIHSKLERIDGREGEADMFATRPWPTTPGPGFLPWTKDCLREGSH